MFGQKADVSKGAWLSQKKGRSGGQRAQSYKGFLLSLMPNKTVEKAQSEWKGQGHSEAQ